MNGHAAPSPATAHTGAPAPGSPRRVVLGLEFAILALIWLNVIALILETVPALHARHATLFRGFERFSIGVFTIEYVVRLVRRGRHYALRPLGIIDLLAILPFYLPAIGVDLRVLRIARTFRAARLFQVAKLGRYSTALQTLGRVLSARRGELVSTLVIITLLLIGAATLMYYAEHGAQPDAFSSIPASLWWAVSTLTTVGYGDIYPITATGRLIGGVVAVLGVGMFALPAGILGAAFIEEHQQLRRASGRCPHCGRE